MLNIHFFTFNAFQENTYIISDEQGRCWLIDPGMYDEQETNALISFIDNNGLKPQAIINTHTHLDHIFGVQAIIDKYNIPFGIHELELPILKRGTETAAMFGFRFTNLPKPSFFIKETEPLVLGDDEIKVFLTPGHSPGSISFYYPQGNWVISGDVLFNGSIGRTDLPGGNFDTLISSINTHLFTLPASVKVFSGHGEETTIGHEQMHNPFLR